MSVQLLKQTWTVTWHITVSFVMWAGLAALFVVPAIKKAAPLYRFRRESISVNGVNGRSDVEHSCEGSSE